MVFAGTLIITVAAWGIVTALKFPTRHPDLRNSAMAYGWVAILLTIPLWAFLAVPVLVAVWLVLSILLTVRPTSRNAGPGSTDSGASAAHCPFPLIQIRT